MTRFVVRSTPLPLLLSSLLKYTNITAARMAMSKNIARDSNCSGRKNEHQNIAIEMQFHIRKKKNWLSVAVEWCDVIKSRIGKTVQNIIHQPAYN